MTDDVPPPPPGPGPLPPKLPLPPQPKGAPDRTMEMGALPVAPPPLFPPEQGPPPQPPGPPVKEGRGYGLLIAVVALAVALIGLGVAAFLVLGGKDDTATDTGSENVGASGSAESTETTTTRPKLERSDVPIVMRSLVGVSTDSAGTGGISGAEEECLVDLLTERLTSEEIERLSGGQADETMVPKIAPAFDQCLSPESLASIYTTILRTAYAQNEMAVPDDQLACAGLALSSKVTFAQMSALAPEVSGAIAEAAQACGISG